MSKKHPYGGVKGRTAEMMVMSNIVKGHLPKFGTGLEEMDQALVQRFERVCSLCWQKDPDSRPKMNDVIQYLHEPLVFENKNTKRLKG